MSQKCEACEGSGVVTKSTADGSADSPCRWCNGSGERAFDPGSQVPAWLKPSSPWQGNAVRKEDFADLKIGVWFRALRDGSLLPGRTMPPLMKVSNEKFIWDEKGNGDWAVYDVAELKKLRYCCFKSFGADKRYWNRVGTTLNKELASLGLGHLRKSRGKASGGVDETDRWDLM